MLSQADIEQQTREIFEAHLSRGVTRLADVRADVAAYLRVHSPELADPGRVSSESVPAEFDSAMVLRRWFAEHPPADTTL